MSVHILILFFKNVITTEEPNVPVVALTSSFDPASLHLLSIFNVLSANTLHEIGNWTLKSVNERLARSEKHSFLSMPDRGYGACVKA